MKKNLKEKIRKGGTFCFYTIIGVEVRRTRYAFLHDNGYKERYIEFSLDEDAILQPAIEEEWERLMQEHHPARITQNGREIYRSSKEYQKWDQKILEDSIAIDAEEYQNKCYPG